MKILSLDQATTKSGWAIFVDDKYESHGLINLSKMSKKETPDKKFETMCLSIYELICNTKPDMVVFESVSVQRNNKTAILLSRIQGVILLSCYIMDIKYLIITPTQWRKALGMKQGQTKSEDLKKAAQVFACEYIKKDKITQDEADAICINVASKHFIN